MNQNLILFEQIIILALGVATSVFSARKAELELRRTNQGLDTNTTITNATLEALDTNTMITKAIHDAVYGRLAAQQARIGQLTAMLKAARIPVPPHPDTLDGGG